MRLRGVVLKESYKRELFAIIDDTSNKSFEDIETIRRQSERLQQAEITPTDKIIRVISHHTKGGNSKAMTKCCKMEPAIYSYQEKES